MRIFSSMGVPSAVTIGLYQVASESGVRRLTQVFNTLEELRDRLKELLSTITSERIISLTS
ncbi:MAG: hypothetical protein ACYTXY_48495, partial [Nostoc sp.]